MRAASELLKGRAGASAVFLCAFFLYLYNLAPHVIWGDSAKLCIQSYTHDLGVSPSMHSLHTIMGYLFGHLPFGNYAYRLNLMSAFWGAAAVAMVYKIVVRLTGSGFSALTAAATFAVSHTLFFLSVITESYTFYTFLLALTLYFALKWSKEGEPGRLYLACFFFCLGMYVHLVIICMSLGLLYCVISSGRRASLGPGEALRLLAASLLGLSPAIIVAVYTGSDVGFYGLVSFLKNDPANIWVSLKAPGELLRGAARYLAMLMYQFPIAGFCLGTVGAIACRHSDRKLFRTLSLMFVCNVIFVLHYGMQKQYSLSIGSYLIFALWIGLGAKRFFESGRASGAVLKAVVLITVIALPFVFYRSTLLAADKFGIDLVHARSIPYRNNNAFFLVPWKRGELGPYLYAHEVFRTAGRGSIIVADFTIMAVLDYFRKVENARDDLRLVFVDYPFSKLDAGLVDSNIDKTSVYLASEEFEIDYNLAELKKNTSGRNNGLFTD